VGRARSVNGKSKAKLAIGVVGRRRLGSAPIKRGKVAARLVVTVTQGATKATSTRALTLKR
jgi:hypothetical protein